MIILAADNNADIAGVLAFSPASGEPMKGCEPQRYVDAVTADMLVLRPQREMEYESVASQLEAFRRACAQTLVVADGVHGSSMLIDSRTDADGSAARAAVYRFIRSLNPGQPSH